VEHMNGGIYFSMESILVTRPCLPSAPNGSAGYVGCTHCWSFIRYVFDPGTASQILQTPLLPSVRSDTATWRYEKNGIYSVRSAYRDIIHNTDVLLQHRVPRHWSTIWKLKLPLKIKNFLWRICRNCLSTRMRLLAKGVDCPNICVVCNDHDEDGKHLFFECNKSIGCWQRLSLWNSIQQMCSPSLSCSEVIFVVLQQFDVPQQQIFSVALWSIWKHRNNKVWNNIVETTQQIGERANSFLSSWKNAQVMNLCNTANNTHHEITRWIKPTVGRFKCNVDTAFSTSLNKVGFGACIRDAEGNFVAGRTTSFTPSLDVDMGEATGLLHAMQWAK